MKNPWLRKAPSYYPVDEICSMTVEDRKAELKGMNASKLRKVIAYAGTQKTVRNAAKARLRRLDNGSKAKGKTGRRGGAGNVDL